MEKNPVEKGRFRLAETDCVRIGLKNLKSSQILFFFVHCDDFRGVSRPWDLHPAAVIFFSKIRFSG